MLIWPALFTCAAVLLLAWWLRTVLRTLRLLRMARSFPGPPAWPLIGNLLDLHGDGYHTFNFMVGLVRKYGPAARIWLGPKLMVVISDPKDIQRVLGDTEIINHDRSMTDALTPFIANGLLTVRDHHWKIHRKLVSASFSVRQLQRYLPAFAANADVLCRRLATLPNATTPDFRQLAGLCTMDAICETAIGVSMGMQDGHNLGFYEGVVEGMSLVHNRVVHPWLLIDWLYPWTSDGKEAARRKQQLAEFTDRVISQTPAQPLAECADDVPGIKPLRTLLCVLREAMVDGGFADGLSVADLRDELTTTAAAGFETTAITMCNLLLLLGLHPQVQEEVSRELDDIFGGDLRASTWEDIRRMDCLDRVLKETLRLLPVVPTLSREIAADLPLPSGRVLPAGSTCLVFSYMVQRDPQHFTEPDAFLPSRWAESATTHRYSYLPFGGGHRNCVGNKFAALQIKAIVSAVLRRFTVSHRLVEDDLRAQALGISMCMTKPYEITFTEKQRATQRLLDAVD